jgi:hypothetical protein
MELLGGVAEEVRSERFVAWRNHHLQLIFETRVKGVVMEVDVTVKNGSGQWLTNFGLKVASQQHIELTVGQVDNPNIMAEKSSRLSLRLENSTPTNKAVALMIQCNYDLGSQHFEEGSRVDFPSGF